MNKEKFEQKFVSACNDSGLTSILKGLNNVQLSQAVRATLNNLFSRLGNESTIIGRVQSIGETTNVSKKETPFNKRELILNASRFDRFTGEEQKNIVTIVFVQKNCEKLDGFKEGDLVEVSFVLQGREYTPEGGATKYITDAYGYNIVSRQQQGAQGGTQAVAAPQPQTPPTQQVAQPQPQQAQEALDEHGNSRAGADALPF